MNNNTKFWIHVTIIGMILAYSYQWTIEQCFIFTGLQFLGRFLIFIPLEKRHQEKKELKEKEELREKEKAKNQKPVAASRKSNTTKKKPIKKKNEKQGQVLYTLKSEEQKKSNISNMNRSTRTKIKKSTNRSKDSHVIENHSSKNKKQYSPILDSFSIKDKKILIVGGKEKWFKQFIEEELQAELIHIEQDKTHKNSNVDFTNLDAVLIYLKFVNHDSTVIPMRKAKENNVPLLFIKRGRGEIKEVLWNQFKEENIIVN